MVVRKINSLKSINYRFPIDIVYIWTDWSCNNFLNSKKYWEEKLNIQIDKNNNDHIDYEGLRYSLRSVQKNAPWINKIYIVTNEEIPKWLDLKRCSSKIKIINQNDIMPPDALPTFNSSAVEVCIANIPDLSEHFILANDNCFINRPIKPDFFFDKKRNPIVRLIKQKVKDETLYNKCVQYSIKLIDKKYGKKYNLVPHHNMDAYRKSYFLDCIKEFEEEFNNVIYQKFKAEGIQRDLVSLYMIKKNKCKLVKLPNKYTRHKDSLFTQISSISKMLDEINETTPYLLCFNDFSGVEPEHAKNYKSFLEFLFPVRCIYENEEKADGIQENVIAELIKRQKKYSSQKFSQFDYKYWYKPFVKTCFDEYICRDFLFGFIPIKKTKIDFSFPVDLVYLWVDGNDKKWQEKKQYWQKKINGIDFQAISAGRFIDNEELRYSLRSAEEFVPWINHIYIVTDNQVPKWLDTTNPKISVIFHKDIIPEENLPLFNSEAIETYLPYIPNLSEHFLYACDDYYFGSALEKSFFYMPDGRPIIRLDSQVPTAHIETSMYARSVLKMQDIVKTHFNVKYPFAPHHNIDAYRKSDFIECLNYFKDDFEKTRNHKFRNEGDIQRVVISYYTIAKKQSVLKKNSRIDKFLSPFTRFKYKKKKRFKKDSIVLSMKNNNTMSILKKWRPGLFCTNDGEGITNLDRLRTKIFLEYTFPYNSSFELDETELGKLNHIND